MAASSPTLEIADVWPARSSRTRRSSPCRRTTGAGLDELVAALDRLVADHAGRRSIAGGRGCGSTGSFAAKGSGTVVTGTLTDGTIASDDHVVVGPGARPAVSVRIQTLGETVGVDRRPATESHSTSPASTTASSTWRLWS